MLFDVETVNGLLGIEDSYQAPEKMMNLMLDDKKRPEIFEKFLKISTDLSFDWFHEYFQSEEAERKTKKQDFTPESVGKLLTRLIPDSKNGTYYEPTAGTGGLVITRWDADRKNDPRSHLPKDIRPWMSVITYDPRRYWYQAEELSDRAIPFLIFNMSIRGMNGVAIQCDSLSRQAKDAYFIRNDSNNYLAFSEIIKLPHTDVIKREFEISEWVKTFAT